MLMARLQIKPPTTSAELKAAATPRMKTVRPSPKTPTWTVGGAAQANDPRTVRGTRRVGEPELPSTESPKVAPSSSAIEHPGQRLMARADSVGGDAYHFGLCTLQLTGLSGQYESEQTLKNKLEQMLDSSNASDCVLQVTVGHGLESDGKPRTGTNTSWAMATLSNVACANQILHKSVQTSIGLEFAVQALNIVAASKAKGDMKAVYDESKRKAAVEEKRLSDAKQAAERRKHEQLKSRIPLCTVPYAGFSFDNCTLHVRNIPKKKSYGARNIAEYEAAVAKLFQDRLEKRGDGHVLQVTIRPREYTTCKKTGEEIPALSWGLVTLDSQESVAAVQQCVSNQPLESFVRTINVYDTPVYVLYVCACVPACA